MTTPQKYATRAFEGYTSGEVVADMGSDYGDRTGIPAGVDESLYYDEDGEPLSCDNERPGPYPGFLRAPRCIRDAGHLEGRYPHDQHEGSSPSGGIYWPVLPGDLDPPQYARKAPGTRVTWYSKIEQGVRTGEVHEISGQDAKVQIDGTVIFDWVPLTWLTVLPAPAGTAADGADQ